MFESAFRNLRHGNMANIYFSRRNQESGTMKTSRNLELTGCPRRCGKDFFLGTWLLCPGSPWLEAQSERQPPCRTLQLVSAWRVSLMLKKRVEDCIHLYPLLATQWFVRHLIFLLIISFLCFVVRNGLLPGCKDSKDSKDSRKEEANLKAWLHF